MITNKVWRVDVLQSKWPTERVRHLKSKLRKVRYSLEVKGELTKLLNELGAMNSSLKDCFERIEVPAPGSSRDRAILALHQQYSQDRCDNTIENARVLHEVLTGSWKCSCSILHEGCLRLHWHTGKVWMPAQFELALSCERLSPGISPASWKTIRMTVDCGTLQKTTAQETTAQKTTTRDTTTAVGSPPSSSPSTGQAVQLLKSKKRVRLQHFLFAEGDKSDGSSKEAAGMVVQNPVA